MDEASLTGEAELVKKRVDRDHMLLGGTQVCHVTNIDSHMPNDVIVVVI